MRPRERAGLVLRRLGKATPSRVRGPLGRVSRRFRSGWQGPLVTVVVAVSDDETTRIGPCLDTLRGQTHRNLEILVVPYGAAGQVRDLALKHAGQDWRIRVVARTATDAAAARTLGAAQSRGSYLMFAAGGDDLPESGVERLVEALELSGSPLAVGRMQAPHSLLPRIVAPYDAAHRTPLARTTLVECPVAVTDLGLGNRLFRRSFWTSAGLRFSSSNVHGTDVALASYSRAETFDLLQAPTYVPTGRADGVSVGAMTDVFSRLDDWLLDQRDTWRAVQQTDLPAATDWWLWGVLDAAIHPFLDDVERATPEQWARLRDHVELLLGSRGEGSLSTLRAESRVKLWLLRHDQRAELEEYVAARLFEGNDRPTDVVDGRVLGRLPFFGDDVVGVPLDSYEMHESETPLQVLLHGVRWTGPASLELDLYTRIQHVSLLEQPDVEVALVRTGTDERVLLPVRQHTDSRANLVEESRHQDYAPGALTAEVDAGTLAASLGSADLATWRLDVRLSSRGLTRQGGVSWLDDRGSAGLIDTGHLAPRLVSGFRVGVEGTEPATFGLSARRDAGVRLREVQVTGRRVSGTIVTGGASLDAVRVTMIGGLKARAPLRPVGADLVFSIEVPRPWTGPDNVCWDFVALDRDGREVQVGWPVEARQWLAVGEGAVAPSRSPTGDVEIAEARSTLVLESVELRDGLVQVSGRWLGTAPERAELDLRGERATIRGALDLGSDGTVRASFATTWDEWGLGAAPLPVDRYWFDVRGEPHDGPPGRVLLRASVIDGLLDFTVTDDFRFRPIRLGREAGIHLLPPVSDDDRGPYAQRRLQEWFRSGDVPLEPQSVYLQSYAGASATDSQLAIHHELRRRHPELVLHWGVADRSSTVPEGGVRVLMRSREWYRVMASATYLCLNIDVDRWFAARPGQQVLQTFHGYPAKSMGIRMWRAKHYTPRRIDLELARTSGDWSLILTPAPEMDVLLPHRVPLRRTDPQRRLPARRRAGLGRRGAGPAGDPGPARHPARPARRPLRSHLARRPGHQLALGGDGAPPRPGVGQPRARPGLRHPDARAPVPRSQPPEQRADLAAARRDRLPRDQRPDPGRGRRGARLLLAALRLRADRPADDLPGARPRGLHRRRPRLPLRLPRHRPGAAGRHR